MTIKKSKSIHKSIKPDTKYDETVSSLFNKPINEFKFIIGETCLYMGGVYNKGTNCTITKQVYHKCKIYYSVIFDGHEKETNWIQETVLQKINNIEDVYNEN